MPTENDAADPFSDKGFDPFWLNNVFPQADDLFQVQQEGVDAIKSECLVFLDANVLLLPYEMGAESFSKIAEIYKGLCENDRLLIPAQAAREFIKNRANKLRDLMKAIGDQASTLNFSLHKDIGFLERDPAFAEIKKQSEIVADARSSILAEIKRLRSNLADNVGVDPVSMVYSQLFSKRVVSIDDDEAARRSLIDEVRWRYKYKVPPGYKDSNKDDGGIGDFLIWKTILEKGKLENNNSLFVTKDLKGDWWVQGQGAFQPRVELLEEYYRYTNGKTIHFVSLSDLLRAFDAENETVTDVQRVEAQIVKQAAIASVGTFVRRSSSTQNSLLDESDNLSRLSLVELIKEKQRLDSEILSSLTASRPVRRQIESPDLVDSMDERSILDLYEEDKRLRNQRSALRRLSHQIQSEIDRRSDPGG